jgi:hypothetical protein
MDGKITKIGGDGAPDFLKSEILVNGPGLADGISELVVIVRLLNANGTVVAGYRPLYQIVSGPSITASVACSLSDGNGIAVCLLRATTPGVRTLRITNVAKALVEGNVSFVAPGPKKKSTGGFVASASSGTTTSGHQIHSSTGNFHSGIRHKTPEGYTVSSSVQRGLTQ